MSIRYRIGMLRWHLSRMFKRYRIRMIGRGILIASVLTLLVLFAERTLFRTKDVCDIGQHSGITNPAPAAPPETPPETEPSYAPGVAFPGVLSSRAYIVFDVSADKVIYEAAADERHDPASLTKVMTFYQTLKDGTHPDKPVTLLEEDFADFYEIGAATAGFLPGETVTLKDLLYGLMLPSGAEAATAIARTVAGTEQAFVARMQKSAKVLGMHDSHFINPTGLHKGDEASLTTPRDLLRLFQAVMRYPEFMEIAGTPVRSIPPTPEHPEGLKLISTFMWKFNERPEHPAVINAGKSGFSGTEQMLGTIAQIGDRKYIVITMAAPVADWTSSAAIEDHLAIYHELRHSYP